ncbi:MAG: hypothetical protein QXF01_02875 [Candidatus Micrarchaeaceae archaeon]
MMRVFGPARAQAALDFMISYGIVFIVLAVTVSVIYKTAINNSYLQAPYCTASPGFACGAYSIQGSTGVLTIQLSQDSGSTFVIGGLACSKSRNETGNLPEYGNVHVTKAAAYYPSGELPGNYLYSGATGTYFVYCYGSSGKATGNIGNDFAGYVWLNYTIPGYGKQIQLVASINAKYT